jgi:hypothetical protein
VTRDARQVQHYASGPRSELPRADLFEQSVLHPYRLYRARTEPRIREVEDQASLAAARLFARQHQDLVWDAT